MNRIKHILIFLCAASAMILAGCNKEEVNGTRLVLLNAESEASTKTSVTDEGVISWCESDVISVYTNDGFKDFTWKSGSGSSATFGAELSGDVEPASFAVYPAGSHSVIGSALTINMPAVYDYSEGVTNSPMVATITDPDAVMQFKHVGGAIKFTIRNVPTNACMFRFKAKKGITGDFAFDGTTISASEDATNCTVEINFTAPATTDNEFCFYVPLPVGTYDDFTIYLYDASGTMVEDSNTRAKSAKNVISAGTLLKMPVIEFKTFSGGGE